LSLLSQQRSAWLLEASKASFLDHSSRQRARRDVDKCIGLISPVEEPIRSARAPDEIVDCGAATKRSSNGLSQVDSCMIDDIFMREKVAAENSCFSYCTGPWGHTNNGRCRHSEVIREIFCAIPEPI
jgi:hypothetical protein